MGLGTHTYTGHQIYVAAQYGVALQEAGQTRGRKLTLHPPRGLLVNSSHFPRLPISSRL